MEQIKTRWFDKVDKNCPLPEYPRPQFVRDDWMNLNGKYEYRITENKTEYPKVFDGEIIVPFSVETELSGVQRPLFSDERLWYRRKFKLSREFYGKRCILNFGAVDWKCAVYINRKLVGTHTGGYCPFSFDITDFLKDRNEENELSVLVYDPTDSGWQQRGKQVITSKGFWYTATSGIWKTVWLEPVNEKHIKKIRLLPDIDNSVINIETVLAGVETTDDHRLNVVIRDGDNDIYCGDISENCDIFIPNQKLWSPESPFLYDLELTLYVGDKECDNIKSYFGMRKYSIENDKDGIPRLYLNNEPYFQRGLLDQGYYPDGGLTAPTDEAMIYDIQTMKDLGFNMLRKHIKIEPERWYYHCDKIGMIVWQDMVSGGKYIGNVLAGVLPNLKINVKDNKYDLFSRSDPKWRENFETELFEMIEMLYNSVSIYCWVPFNEGWGQFDAKSIAERVKAYDSSRIVDHASGWHDQKGPDLHSIHRYILPVPHVRNDGRPYVLSEFGGYSRIIDGHVWDKEKSFGYIMFKTRDSLTDAYEGLMKKQIMPLIKKNLCAFVYTQVSDVEFEVNGILTYDREFIKIDPDTIKELNAQMKY
ncbi:MAG: glycoside hydrolase family 2 [Clostridiales bacterium]|nr:glycoside hydrolase family 2 [Clostridiales bacterium]